MLTTEKFRNQHFVKSMRHYNGCGIMTKFMEQDSVKIFSRGILVFRGHGDQISHR